MLYCVMCSKSEALTPEELGGRSNGGASRGDTGGGMGGCHALGGRGGSWEGGEREARVRGVVPVGGITKFLSYIYLYIYI
jgi:hypothetical protein